MKEFCKKIVLFIFGITLSGIFVSCPQPAGSGDEEIQPQALLAPVFTPSSGEFRESFKEITIKNMNSQGDIFFTTDGSVPTAESPRYTESFTIYSSKTVKAICIYNKTTSPVATAKYELNAGKTQSQMGVITGKIGLSNNLSEPVKEKLKNSEIFIFSDDLPGIVKSCKLGESYYFDGLDTSETYDFYFTNVEPGIIPGTKKSRSATVQDKNEQPVVANKISINPEDGAGIEVDVNLSATGYIKGIAKRYNVSGDEENDHGGTVVYIPGTSYSAYTDKNGNFTMSGIPQGLHTIRAQYAGYSFVEKQNVLLQTNDENVPDTIIEETFNLSFGKGIVKGSVVLCDATEVGAHAGILISLSEPANTYSYSAITNQNGNFSIVDVYPGTYTIEISKEGYESSIISDIKVTGASVTTIPSTTLQVLGGSLSGQVTVNGLSEYNGITVLAENENGKKYFGIVNSTGEFFWDKVSPGIYKITANCAGYKSVSVSDVIVALGADISNIQLTISEKATYSITGKVLREGMDSDFEGTSVVADNAHDKSFSKSAITGTDGTYILSELEPGDYMITISREGYITDNSNYVSIGTRAIEVIPDVLLKNALGTVKGSVQLESALDNSGIAILLNSEQSDKTYSTITDSLGRFSISGIAPGTWRVQATKSGYNTVISDAFSVNAGNTSEISSMELKISQRSIYGSVLLEGRTDATGVRITATNLNKTNEIYSALSNKDGFYALSGMTPGEYILSYSYEGYRSYTGSSVDLKEDSSLNLESVTLIKATGKITGIVNLEGCADHSGIEVTLVGTDYKFITKSDGSYEFTVPSGNYPGGVRFSREDFQLTAKAETIPVLTDSTYGVLTVEMKCISVPVYGKIDLLGTDDDSGIKVTVDGVENVESVTDTEGKWNLEHIPLGYNTFRFTKTNVPEVTCQKLIEPCNSFDAGSMEMIPDSATLKGIVTLDGMTDNSNIIVTVTTFEKEDIVVRTNAAGTFEVTNVLASGTHEVIFSKEGWDSQSFTVNELTPLETRTVSDPGDYILKDTAAPQLSSVVLNGGANFTNNPLLEVALTAEDKGSGLKKMAVQVSRVKDDGTIVMFPTEKSFEDYKVSFNFDLSSLPVGIWANNDEYSLNVTVKDASGNISETKTDSITITDQSSILKGVLTGDDLHLTKAKSPYRVESSILCQEGDTLVIDPGVEIQFAGNYYLKVDGCIQAIGTDEQRIIFTNTPEMRGVDYTWDEWVEFDPETGDWLGEYVTKHASYDENWSGIRILNTGNNECFIMENDYSYLSGNTLQYCDIEYAQSPLSTEEACFFNALRVKESCSESILLFSASQNLFNCELNSGVVVEGGQHKLINNIIKGTYQSSSDSNTIINNNFVELVYFDVSDGYGTQITNNKFISLRNPINLWPYITDNFSRNNFEDCSGILVNSPSYSERKEIFLKNNYWGPVQTEELVLIGNKANASFINDYYDNFELARVDYSDWAQEPYESCGYLGNSFIDFYFTVNWSGAPIEPSDPLVYLEVNELYGANSLENARFALSLEELKKSTWGDINQTLILDRAKTKNGFATIYAQTKDSKGNLSSIKMEKVAYDIPKISFENSLNEFSDDIRIEFRIVDHDIIACDNITATINGALLSDIQCVNAYTNGEYEDGYHFTYEYSPNIKLMAAGEYVLSVSCNDSAGNKVTENFNFRVVRNTDISTYKGVTFNNTTGQLIKDEKTAYLWHFDGNTKEVNGAEYATLGMNLEKIEIDQERVRLAPNGINGSVSLISTGWDGSILDRIPLKGNTNSYTVEFWQKGESWSASIGKRDLFAVNNSNYGIENTLYYTTDESNVYSETLYYNKINKKIDSDWHYYTNVFTDTYMAIYRDGQLVSSSTFSKVNWNCESNNNYLEIIFFENEGTCYDELRISTCARTPDEIKAYYDCASPLYNSVN